MNSRIEFKLKWNKKNNQQYLNGFKIYDLFIFIFTSWISWSMTAVAGMVLNSSDKAPELRCKSSSAAASLAKKIFKKTRIQYQARHISENQYMHKMGSVHN